MQPSPRCSCVSEAGVCRLVFSQPGITRGDVPADARGGLSARDAWTAQPPSSAGFPSAHKTAAGYQNSFPAFSQRRGGHSPLTPCHRQPWDRFRAIRSPRSPLTADWRASKQLWFHFEPVICRAQKTQSASKSAPVPREITTRKTPLLWRPITVPSSETSLTIGPGPVP